jgi:D-aminoacyl-tRNA deacylase
LNIVSRILEAIIASQIYVLSIKLNILDYRYYTLVASKQDLASMTMVDYLKNDKGFSITNSNNNALFLQSEAYKNVNLFVSNKNLLYLEDLDDISFWKSKDLLSSYIFLSKHVSESGIPTLTCHCTGNYADNPYGGNRREIAISYPYLQKQYLMQITNAKSSIPGYDIVIEATHHGPTSLKKPVLFIEIGSTEWQWIDRNATSFVCNCLLNIIGNRLGKRCEKVGIGLGGTHYPIKFNKLLLRSEFGLAAVATKYDLKSIDENMLKQMIAKSIEEVNYIVVDWKGLGKEKKRIMELVEDTGLNVLKI